MKDVKPGFKKLDYLVVRRAMDHLPFLSKHIIELRFWENYSIDEISNLLEISWDEVELHLNLLFLNLQKFCLEDSDFSRRQPALKAA